MAWASIIALLGLAAAAETTYAWPLDLPKILTSSFAEYRAGRFHAGIDLRTGGIGKAVRAPADGCVSRVRCSPWGYGKAVYLRLDDGRTVVFGHLDRFLPSLREYVYQAQHAKQSYTVDLYPGPGQFPVGRGEIVAASGQTGIGVPHLHYEIRDPDEHPINPRLLGITWPDASRPVIRKVLVAPAGPDSRVNGDVLPVALEARRGATGTYVCERVRVSGLVGFGLDVIDPANNGENTLGVHTVRTVAGEDEIFRISHDRLSYDNHRNQVVSYHPFLLGQGRFLVQWRWPGNVCEVYQQAATDGWYAVPPDVVEVRLEAADFFGNEAVVTVPLEPDQAERPSPPAQPGAGQGAVDVRCVGTWLVATVRFSAPERDAPVLEIDGPRPAEGGAFRRVDDRTFRVGVAPAPGTGELTLRVVHERVAANERRILVFDRDGPARTVGVEGVEVRVKPRSPYGTLFLRAYRKTRVSRRSIPMRGPAIRFWPPDSPIDEPVDLGFPIPPGASNPDRLGVYRDTGSYWAFVSAQRRGNRLVASTRQLGTYAVMEDTEPPVIADIVAGPGARPTIAATVRDVGSGVADVTVTCNGQWLLMAYDPERRRVEWEQDEDLPEGPKELRFTVTDGAGNTATAEHNMAPPGDS